MKQLVCITILVICFAGLHAQTPTSWTVPAQYTTAKNPEPITIDGLLSGKKIYSTSCAACHGVNADGKGLLRTPSFKTSTFTNQSDGTIFYKISTGRGQMPGFKGQLSEQQIWQVIHYLRSHTDKTHYPVISLKPVIIKLLYDSTIKKISATVVNEQNDTLAGVLLQFYARQSFGWFPLTQSITESSKKIEIPVPHDIVGDSMGKLIIKAQLKDNPVYMDTASTIIVRAVKQPPHAEPFFSQRTLWNIQSKSPRWLIVMSSVILITVYGTLLYVLALLLRMRKQGKVFLK